MTGGMKKRNALHERKGKKNVDERTLTGELCVYETKQSRYRAIGRRGRWSYRRRGGGLKRL